MDELLAAETRVDGHHEDQLHVRQDLLQDPDGCGRIDYHARLLTQRVDVLHRAVEVHGSLLVDQERIPTCLGKGLQVAIGLLDHQVNF